MESMSEGAEQVKFCSSCSVFKSISDFYCSRGKPHGYCKECTLAKSHKRYQANPIACGEAMRKRKIRRRMEMIAAYGGKCECCSIHEQKFLTLDHIDGGGNEHRRLLKSVDGVLRELEKLGWPKAGYRLLCYNCNCGRSRTRSGLCPHYDSQIKTFEFVPKPSPEPLTKVCPRCGEEKAIAEDFFVHPSGVSPYCKPCMVSWRRERRRQLRAGVAFPRSAPSGLDFFKYCGSCGLWKLRTDFHRNSSGDAGKLQLQGWCIGCSKIQREARRERDQELSRLRGAKLRSEVIQAYGGTCVFCGEREWGFLTIDHINGGGSRERKTPGLKGSFYRRLKRDGFPKDRYRLLCYNCNCSRAFCLG